MTPAEEMPWVIFDIDGTLADVSHRLHHLKDCEHPDYDKFNSECLGDDLKSDIKSLHTLCFDAGWNICVMSGRDSKYQKETIQWLDKHNINYNLLLMRPEGNYTPDSEIKRELFVEHLFGKDVRFVVDDRQKVVDMWREIGLTCLQCQKGDY